MTDTVIDLVIRNGNVFDGSGSPGRTLDIGMTAGRIEAVESPGRIPPATQEIDATGQVVTPGFIDTHSHLDGAVVWESRLEPNSGHGITTTIMGNCGVGFAESRTFPELSSTPASRGLGRPIPNTSTCSLT